MDAQTIIAKRIALELRSGMLVNLGIGIPTQVANYLPAGIDVFFQSENGLIGMQAFAEQGLEADDLTDAGGRPISALPGAATFDSAVSFGLIRGGHLDVTVLGGLPDNTAYLEELAGALKRSCATGGTVRSGAIELAGDVRDRVRPILAKRGITVKG